ncbi:Oidioi.mRNA.OKI2018_I69.PAR.g9419.t2.cds [Oikopleura dioica]|uniref:Oidioi.mRNA.OKI2018_I69.PAR.g9419.t2.cds n=1 Tax=Oikopleura dioica TaxID=34765 RepID=A0ABN7RLE9_OIKDI|nr:Oidioi.mRNA.OKI2018_I69.PAR.g9419.t2.cds [Oikopleura dioica]
MSMPLPPMKANFSMTANMMSSMRWSSVLASNPNRQSKKRKRSNMANSTEIVSAKIRRLPVNCNNNVPMSHVSYSHTVDNTELKDLNGFQYIEEAFHDSLQAVIDVIKHSKFTSKLHPETIVKIISSSVTESVLLHLAWLKHDELKTSCPDGPKVLINILSELEHLELKEPELELALMVPILNIRTTNKIKLDFDEDKDQIVKSSADLNDELKSLLNNIGNCEMTRVIALFATVLPSLSELALLYKTKLNDLLEKELTSMNI